MEKRIVDILRTSGDDNQSIGALIVSNGNGNTLYISGCLERGWLDNKKDISCIPTGIYPLVYEYSPKFDRMLWEVKEVPSRSECKFHAASFWKNLNGCISPGTYLEDLNNDGYVDMAYSGNALERFHKAMGDVKEAQLRVYDIRRWDS